MKQKKCKECNIIKDVSLFYKSKVHTDGYENICKPCKRNKYSTPESRKEYSKLYHLKNKEKANNISSEYYKTNRERSKRKSRERTSKHKGEINRKLREKRKNNPELNRNACKRYRDKNKEKMSELNKEWRNKQSEEYKYIINEKRRNEYNSNPELRKIKAKCILKNKKRHTRNKTDLWLKSLLRVRILNFLKMKKERKNKKTIELIGSDFKTVISYLDKLKYDRNNHDLDHIVPLSAFNIRDEKHQKVMFHYFNMRPENKYYNRYIKSNKLIHDWKRYIKKIGKIRDVDINDIILYIENKLSKGELKYLND